jgi:hypothetical protein
LKIYLFSKDVNVLPKAKKEKKRKKQGFIIQRSWGHRYCPQEVS